MEGSRRGGPWNPSRRRPRRPASFSWARRGRRLRLLWACFIACGLVLALWLDGRLPFLPLPDMALSVHLEPGGRGLPARLEGRAAIVDGDTLEIQGRRVRLFGIDAPEYDQLCRNAGGRSYLCGHSATNALADLVRGRLVSCLRRDLDPYGRIVAVCSAAGEDVNGRMVSRGWAVAYTRYSWAYLDEELEARWHKRSLWEGEFTNPESWRHAR